MSNIFDNGCLLKSEFARRVKMHPKTFKRFLLKHDKELVEVDLNIQTVYLLSPKVQAVLIEMLYGKDLMRGSEFDDK